MRSVTLFSAAFFTAAFATPLPDDLGDLPSPNSFVPAPGTLVDTFQIPADQPLDLDSDEAPNPGNQVFAPTDTEAVTEAKLNINNDPEKSTIQVASAAASPPDATVNLFDTSNTDQSKFRTSLNLPALSPSSNTLGTVLSNLADDPGKAASVSDSTCVDSGTGSAPKLRRDFLDFFWNFVNGGDRCIAPSAIDNTIAPPAPPPKAAPSLLPGPQRPDGPNGPILKPKARPPGSNGPQNRYESWYHPRINGGPGLGGEASCAGSFHDTNKVFTVVCAGIVRGWNGYTARSVDDCQIWPGNFEFTSRVDYPICTWCCKDYLPEKNVGKGCKPLFCPQVPNE